MLDAPETPRPARAPRAPARGKTSAAMLAGQIALLSEGVALLRGPHWSKTPEQVRPLAEPLAVWYDNQDAHFKKRLERAAGPVALFMGFAMAFGDSIVIEVTNVKRSLAGRAGSQPDRPRAVRNGVTPEPVSAGGVGGDRVSGNPFGYPTAGD